MAKKEEIKVVKRTKVEKEMTLLRAIENVVEVSKNSKLKAEAKAIVNRILLNIFRGFSKHFYTFLYLMHCIPAR